MRLRVNPLTGLPELVARPDVRTVGRGGGATGASGGGGAVDSVNGQTGVVVIGTDDVLEGATNKYISATDKVDLTDGGDSTLHYHASDRSRANHTGTQAISTVTGLQTALDDKVDDATLSTNGKGYVNHGSTASTSRPSGFASIEWQGSVEPANIANGDTWIYTP